MCAHVEPAYATEPWHSAPDHMPDTDLRHSEEATRRAVILPLYPQMTDEEQDRVVWALRRAIDRARAHDDVMLDNASSTDQATGGAM
jgi:dTDP-4-amino-4,6-dideoxygalactose transaminase